MEVNRFFRLPDNFNQQIDFCRRIVIGLSLGFSLVLAAVVVSHIFDFLPLQTFHAAPVALFLMLFVLLMVFLMVSTDPRQINLALNSLLSFTVLGTYIVYVNGYMPVTFTPFSILLSLLAYRGRFRLLVPYLLVAGWSLAAYYSPLEAPSAEPYVVRLLATSAIIIWPLNTLVDAQDWHDELRNRALQQLFIGALTAALGILFYDLFISSLNLSLVPVIVALTLLSLILGWVKISTSSISKNIGRLIGLGLLVAYLMAIAENHFIPAMMLPVIALLFYLLLPTLEAMIASLGLLIAGFYGFSLSFIGDPGFDLLPFVFRYVALSLLLITTLYQMFLQFQHKYLAGMIWSQSIKLSGFAYFVFFALTSGFLIYWAHHGFVNHTGLPLSVDDINILTLNAFVWLLITWLSTAFAINYSRLTKVTKQLIERNNQIARNDVALNASGIGIEWLDIHSGKFVYVNEHTAKMLGYTVEQMLDMSVPDIDPGFPQGKFQESVAFVKDNPMHRFETTHRRVDGSVFPLEIVSFVDHTGPENRPILIRFTQDISERKQRDAEREKLQKMLQDNHQQQKDLFAMIGHELRTPAATLKMLIDDSPDDRDPRVVETLDHLLTVLDDMSVVTNPDKAIQGKLLDASVEKVIRDLISTQDRLLQSMHLKVRIKADSGALQKCIINAQLLRQIVLNLMKNAALHGQASHFDIDISSTDQDNRLHIRVLLTDNGKGIMPDYQAKLFMAFERGDSKAEGTGLGLHLSQKFARESLQGDLVYNSEYKQGSQFILTMDLPKSSANSADAETMSSVLNSIEGMRIIFAEDNVTLRELTIAMLEDLGAEVMPADNGIVALNLIKTKPADVLLTDAFMPEMDGFELITETRKSGFVKPIVAITAATVGVELERLQKCGADYVFSKPLDFRKFVDLVGHEKSISSASADANSLVKEPQQSSAVKIFDYGALLQNLNNNRTILIKAVSSFIDSTSELLEQMNIALSEARLEVVKDLAHQVSGNAKSLYAAALAEQAVELEKMAADQQAQGLEKAIDVTCAEFERLKNVLQVYLESSST